jgi:hypothetical protein
VSAVDQLVERGAERLEALSRRFAHENGVKAKLAHELADDAAFLRKLKPSLIAARARGGDAPAEIPTEPKRDEPPSAPSGAQVSERRRKPRKPRKRASGGPNPFVVAGAAFAAGIVLAKWIDWRGHAHPR